MTIVRSFAVVGVLLAVAGCGSIGAPTAAPSELPGTPVGYPGWPPSATFELIPVPVSTELVVGRNRLLVNLIDAANEPLAAPDRAVELRLYDLATNSTDPALTTAATYMPTIEGRPGLYRAQVDFGRAGEWGLEAIATETDGGTRTGRMIFSVRESGSTPAIGAAAPRSVTPTAATADDVALISTDPEPDPDFYRVSIDEAITAQQPFVVIFATPAFCSSATCGPTLSLVKSVAATYKDGLTFIHVEPYVLKSVDGHLQPELSPDNLPVPVPAVNEWGLPTEPYIFVVDAAGNVTAKFEGIAAVDELNAALSAVARPT